MALRWPDPPACYGRKVHRVTRVAGTLYRNHAAVGSMAARSGATRGKDFLSPAETVNGQKPRATVGRFTASARVAAAFYHRLERPANVGCAVGCPGSPHGAPAPARVRATAGTFTVSRASHATCGRDFRSPAERSTTNGLALRWEDLPRRTRCNHLVADVAVFAKVRRAPGTAKSPCELARAHWHPALRRAGSPRHARRNPRSIIAPMTRPAAAWTYADTKKG